MASGDTKTEAMLNALGNGGSADEFRGCCNTKTQQYILDAIDRVQNVEDEVEELKNNPDVVDIVDTYADLQAYDTQHLTENDIIRVLADETHSGNSTYYRFTKNPDTWTFIGEIAGGGGGSMIELTSSDVNFDPSNVGHNTAIALWLLDEGVYVTGDSTTCYTDLSGPTSWVGVIYIISKAASGKKSITKIVSYDSPNENAVVYVNTSDGSRQDYCRLTLTVSQLTGNSQTSVMSQNAVTSMVFADPSVGDNIKIGNTANTGSNQYNIAIGSGAHSLGLSATAVGPSSYARGTGAVAIGVSAGDGANNRAGAVSIGNAAKAKANGAIAIGSNSEATSVGEMNIGTTSTSEGYSSSNYRLISGVHDGQSAHDAATVGQINATIDAINAALSINIPHVGA